MRTCVLFSQVECLQRWVVESVSKGISMVLFYYTLVVILLVLAAVFFCLSAFLVSRNKSFLYLSGVFLAYFFDVSLVFLDDFSGHAVAERYWIIGSPLLSVVTGFFVFLFLTFAIGYFLDTKKKALLVAPACAWAALSLLLLVVIPDARMKMFAFYLPRALFVLALALLLFLRYLSLDSGVLKLRLKRFRWIALGAVLLTVGIVAEDVYFILIYTPEPSDTLWFMAERNFFENLLFLLLAIASCHFAGKYLFLRHEAKVEPDGEDASLERAFRQTLPSFSQKNNLTARESEILELVIRGKDNQCIASHLSISLSTVKVHMSSILKKTGCANRKELSQKFWQRY